MFYLLDAGLTISVTANPNEPQVHNVDISWTNDSYTFSASEIVGDFQFTGNWLVSTGPGNDETRFNFTTTLFYGTIYSVSLSYDDADKCWESFSTTPISPLVSKIEVDESSINVFLEDEWNLHRDGLLFYHIIIKSKQGGDNFEKQTQQSSSSITFGNEPDWFDKKGACTYSIEVSSSLNGKTSTPRTSDLYRFVTLPKSIENVTFSTQSVSRVEAEELFHNPHEITVEWTDKDNCDDTINYLVEVSDSEGHVASSGLVLGSEKKFEAFADFQPGAIYNAKVTLIYENEITSLSETSPSVSKIDPLPPTITKVDVDNENVTIEIEDLINANNQNIFYKLVFTGSNQIPDVTIPSGSSSATVALSTISKNGACSYQVQAKSVYNDGRESVLSKSERFTTLPKVVADVTLEPIHPSLRTGLFSDWTPDNFENPHRFSVEVEDNLNCIDSVEYLAQVVDHASNNVIHSTLFDKLETEMSLFMFPAAVYDVNVTVLSGHKMSEPFMLDEIITTAPVPPSNIDIIVGTNNVTVVLIDKWNLQQSGNIYQIEMVNSLGNNSPVPAPADPSGQSVVGAYKSLKRKGACFHTLTANTISHTAFSERTREYYFLTLPIPVTGFNFHLTPPDSVLDPYNASFTWTDAENCWPDVIYQLDLKDLSGNTLASHLIKGNDKGGNGHFEVYLQPSLTAVPFIAVISNNTYSSSTKGEPKRSNPVPPRISDISIDDDLVSISIEDVWNYETNDVNYELILEANGWQMSSILSPDNMTVDFLTNGNLSDIYFGACIYKASVRTIRADGANSSASAITTFSTKPLPVTNVTISSNAGAFINPHEVKVTWNDNFNSPGAVDYFVDVFYRKGVDNILLSTKKVRGTEREATFQINLTPSQTLTAYVTALTHDFKSEPINSQQFSAFPTHPTVESLSILDDGKVLIVVADNYNDLSTIEKYQVIIDNVDSSESVIFDVSTDTMAVEIIPANDFNKPGACLYQITTKTIANDGKTSNPSEQGTFLTLPTVVSSVDEMTLNTQSQRVDTTHQIQWSWTDLNNCPERTSYLVEITTLHGKVLATDSRPSSPLKIDISLFPAEAIQGKLYALSPNGNKSESKDSNLITTLPVPVSRLETKVLPTEVTIMASDEWNVEKEKLQYEFSFTNTQSSTPTVKTLTENEIGNYSINLEDLTTNTGACTFTVKSVTKIDSMTSTKHMEKEFKTLPKKVQEGLFQLVDGKIFENPHEVKLTWNDNENCQDSVVYLVEMNEQKSGTLIFSKIECALYSTVLVNLLPSTTYEASVTAVADSQRSEPEKFTTTFFTRPVPPTISQVQPSSDKIMVKIEDNENQEKDDLMYELVIHGPGLNRPSQQLQPNGIMETEFILSDFKFQGACSYNLQAFTLRSRVTNSSATNVQFETWPLPVSEVTVEINKSKQQSESVTVQIDVSWNDDENCGSVVEYHVTLNGKLETGITDKQKRFILSNQLPGTSYIARVKAVSRVMNTYSDFVEGSAVLDSTENDLDAFVVKEDANSFFLAISDTNNYKLQYSKETLRYINYTIEAIPVDYHFQENGTVVCGTTGFNPFSTLQKPTTVGGCYFFISLRSEASEQYSSVANASTTLTTDPVPVDTIEWRSFDEASSNENVLFNVAWNDSQNCRHTRLSYYVVIYQLDYFNRESVGSQVDQKHEFIKVKQVDSRFKIDDEIVKEIKLENAGRGCQFVGEIVTELENAVDLGVYQRFTRQSSPKPFELFSTTPFDPTVSLKTQKDYSMQFRIDAHPTLSCYSEDNKPKFTLTITSDLDELWYGMGTDVVSGNFMFPGLDAMVQLNKNRKGACDYTLKAFTSAFGKESSDSSSFLFQTGSSF